MEAEDRGKGCVHRGVCMCVHCGGCVRAQWCVCTVEGVCMCVHCGVCMCAVKGVCACTAVCVCMQGGVCVCVHSAGVLGGWLHRGGHVHSGVCACAC